MFLQQGEEGVVPDYTFDYDEDLGQLSGSVDSQQSESEILEEIVDNTTSGDNVLATMPANKITGV